MSLVLAIGYELFAGRGWSIPDTYFTLYTGDILYTFIKPTIVESCKKNDLDPRAFLLKSLADAAAGRDLITPLEYAQHIRAK